MNTLPAIHPAAGKIAHNATQTLFVRQRQFIRKNRQMAFLNTLCQIKTNTNTNPNPKIQEASPEP